MSFSSTPLTTPPIPSHMGRIIDPRYPTHLAMLLLCTVGGAVWFILTLLQGQGLSVAFTYAFRSALNGFLTWLIARELDPDHQLSAFVGMGIALFFVTESSAVGILVLATLARLVGRVVGPAPRTTDLAVIVLGLSAGMIWLGISYWLVLGMALGFFSDVALDYADTRTLNRLTLAGGIALLMVGILGFFILDQPIGVPPSPRDFMILLGVYIGYMIFALRSTHFTTLSDFGEAYPVNDRRLQLSLIITALIALTQLNQLWAYLPIWLAMFGTILYAIANRIILQLRRT
ncbi:MAG: hypothetical protein ACOYLB_16665 [Phototrophicaceae bacterium]